MEVLFRVRFTSVIKKAHALFFHPFAVLVALLLHVGCCFTLFFAIISCYCYFFHVSVVFSH